jgi:hypothetical protein
MGAAAYFVTVSTVNLNAIKKYINILKMALAYHQTQLLPLYFLAVAICAYLPGRGPFTLALLPAPFLSIKNIYSKWL